MEKDESSFTKKTKSDKIKEGEICRTKERRGQKQYPKGGKKSYKINTTKENTETDAYGGEKSPTKVS